MAFHLIQFLVSMLLVIVCVNVAILVYARTVPRQAEIAVRSALGAGRRRIVAQLFIEALALAAGGRRAGPRDGGAWPPGNRRRGVSALR